MTKELDLFEGKSEAYKNMLAQLEGDDNLTGGDFGPSKRISIRGAMFREVINGNEVEVYDSRKLNVIIVKAAPISRTYYESVYSEGDSKPPTCWSGDNKTPAQEVIASNRQSQGCSECPQNIKGSGEGDSRACRYHQRLAIMLESNIDADAVYQLNLPATSIFGDNKDQMSMQTYARFLKAHNTPSAAIVTEMCFAKDSSTPKLTFKAIRPLEEDELRIAIGVQNDPETAKILEFTVANQEVVGNTPAELPALFDASSEDEDEDEDEEVSVPKKEVKKKPKPVVIEEEEEDDDEEEEEPVKVTKKKAAKPVADDDDLADLLEDWDD